MIRVTIPAEAYRQAGIKRTAYRDHVINSGHRPGVLSGTELQGKAKTYGASYARSRAAARTVVRLATQGQVINSLTLVDRGYRDSKGQWHGANRWCSIWVDLYGNPVELTINDYLDYDGYQL